MGLLKNFMFQKRRTANTDLSDNDALTNKRGMKKRQIYGGCEQMWMPCRRKLTKWLSAQTYLIGNHVDQYGEVLASHTDRNQIIATAYERYPTGESNVVEIWFPPDGMMFY